MTRIQYTNHTQTLKDKKNATKQTQPVELVSGGSRSQIYKVQSGLLLLHAQGQNRQIKSTVDHPSHSKINYHVRKRNQTIESDIKPVPDTRFKLLNDEKLLRKRNIEKSEHVKNAKKLLSKKRSLSKILDLRTETFPKEGELLTDQQTYTENFHVRNLIDISKKRYRQKKSPRIRRPRAFGDFDDLTDPVYDNNQPENLEKRCCHHHHPHMHRHHGLRHGHRFSHHHRPFFHHRHGDYYEDADGFEHNKFFALNEPDMREPMDPVPEIAPIASASNFIDKIKPLQSFHHFPLKPLIHEFPKFGERDISLLNWPRFSDIKNINYPMPNIPHIKRLEYDADVVGMRRRLDSTERDHDIIEYPRLTAPTAIPSLTDIPTLTPIPDITSIPNISKDGSSKDGSSSVRVS